MAYLKNNIAFDLGTSLVRICKNGKLQTETPPLLEEKGKIFSIIANGKIASLYGTEQFVKQEIKKIQKPILGFLHPSYTILVSIPAGASEIDLRAYRDVMECAGAKQCFMLQDCFITLTGLEVDIKNSVSMLVDFGAGKTSITTLEGYKILRNNLSDTTGDSIDEAIWLYLRREYNLEIDKTEAEKLKIQYADLSDKTFEKYIAISGKEKHTDKSKSITILNTEISNCVKKYIDYLVDSIIRHYENLDEDIMQKVKGSGIYLIGRGFKLKGVIEYISKQINISPKSYNPDIYYLGIGLEKIQSNPGELYKYLII
ncbi:actin-like ATPase involved in cell morphogenesis [Parabacteroides sp. PF5-5]|uniref:rod shape-determining protein n=1 Tax=unclassified Parabacteroides TaxID=2649774 RepID=UPI002473FA58|nr:MULTISPECIES: rod shape-determining protein [unclassified Parabacteroides]MDH6305109.1 actin-like ATPase involved in cell morphogenesis [Parabacteroides sp. PH5-39]MDH6316459.1 actin-like ATPase involved in cell morphogenesis [Parabacteroides sp. PF5-13]MDH6319969.1 actin-like ATPase involved in cell morphogenesis [Parabacteroides sp. PH5-13]MDH6323798.1 actin-like ATPase involved in cell morphogenesis [Parabacteroides sp. PH5-8]MDH6327646.1 actin-like ATPase involved in cell morphogenesis 